MLVAITPSSAVWFIRRRSWWKIMILLLSDKSLEYIKSKFPEYFNSHKEHIALYRNYCSAKKTFDAKFRTRMNTYDSIISFSPSELEQLLAGYEERLKKKETKQ
jgi:hypothetical protein